MPRTDGARTRIAVVGTGLAGLVAAYLLDNDADERYSVHVFECGPEPSLAAASISIKNTDGHVSHVDVPMRAFTGGYYHTLKAMYDFLGIQYRRQRFRFIFSASKHFDDGEPDRSYFVHTSNNHELPPPRPRNLSLASYLVELLFVATLYFWLAACCLLVQPTQSTRSGRSETLDEYLTRIMMPKRFVSLYLLPLMSAVATCSHEELLRFPASDVVTYRKLIMFGDQFVVRRGIRQVQDSLAHGLNLKTSALVTRVDPTNNGATLHIESRNGNSIQTTEEVYDQVILAVPPNVAASIFLPAQKQLSQLPTRSVTTVIHRPFLSDQIPQAKPGTEDIYLHTSGEGGGRTQASHHQRCDVVVTSNPDAENEMGDIMSRSTFTRTLRTPTSQAIVNEMFEFRVRDAASCEKSPNWRNGDLGVWMVGAWCWDGMVLLEGAVVSAVRVAKAFGIEIPWEHDRG